MCPVKPIQNPCELTHKDNNHNGKVELEEITGTMQDPVTMWSDGYIKCDKEQIKGALKEQYGLEPEDLKKINSRDMREYISKISGIWRDVRQFVFKASNEGLEPGNMEDMENGLKRDIQSAEEILRKFGKNAFVEAMVKNVILRQYNKLVYSYNYHIVKGQFPTIPGRQAEENALKNVGRLCGKTGEDIEKDIRQTIKEVAGEEIGTFLGKALEAAKGGGTDDMAEYIEDAREVGKRAGIPIDEKEVEKINNTHKEAQEMLSNPEKLKEHLTIYAPLLKAVIAMPASYRVRREFLEESLASGSYFKVSILDDKEKELFSLRINVTAAGVFVKEFITDKVSIEVNRPEMTEIKGLLEELIKTTNI